MTGRNSESAKGRDRPSPGPEKLYSTCKLQDPYLKTHMTSSSKMMSMADDDVPTSRTTVPSANFTNMNTQNGNSWPTTTGASGLPQNSEHHNPVQQRPLGSFGCVESFSPIQNYFYRGQETDVFLRRLTLYALNRPSHAIHQGPTPQIGGPSLLPQSGNIFDFESSFRSVVKDCTDGV